MHLRKGETKKKSCYRSDRFFRSGESWYFTTREKWDIGPFKVRDEAERAALRYANAIKAQKTSTVARKIALKEDWDALDLDYS